MGNTKHYIWSAVDKFGTQIISFVSNILIARILSPDDYGLVAMLAIFTTIVMSLSDAGFNDGLIRKSDCDKKDFGTIASYNLAVALFMFAVMNIAAPYIAIFFGRNELTNIARVLAIGFILKAITLTGFVQLRTFRSLRGVSDKRQRSVTNDLGQIAAHFVGGPVAVVDSDVSGPGHKQDALFDQSKETLLERTVHFGQAGGETPEIETAVKHVFHLLDVGVLAGSHRLFLLRIIVRHNFSF